MKRIVGAIFFELKYDGFRALAIVEHGRAQLLSRNGHPFVSFSALAESTTCVTRIGG
jgi:ATP-dependent DNA ligase